MREQVELLDQSRSSLSVPVELPSLSLGAAFRNSMRNLAASVTVVTVGTGEEASGFTATSVVSLSVDPPALLVSVNRNSASWPLLQRTGRFAVNILALSHADIADTFAGRRGLKGSGRYVDPRWKREGMDVPYLTDALSVLECELEETIPRYSHAILIGRVAKVIEGGTERPLVYWQGAYTQLRENSGRDQA